MKLGSLGNLSRNPNSVKTTPASRQPIHPSGRPALRSAIAAEQRKRAQRVLLRVRTNIHVALKGKQATFETTTVSVHPQGALIVVQQNLPLDTHVILEHSTTKEKVGCRVARPAREMPDGFHVPLEFDSAAPGFWKIVFPPLDPNAQ